MKKNAIQMMEELMETGIYPEIKNLTSRDKTIKKEMKERLSHSEVKRHEFKKHGIVAKFIPKRINDIDYQGLNEYLSNLGLLVPIVQLDSKRVKENLFLSEQLECYKMEPEYYVKPSFNNLGKSLNKPSTFIVQDWNMNALMEAYQPLQREIKRYEDMYEEAKRKMLHCPELRRQKKLKHNYGSISLAEKKPEYDIHAIYEELGEDILIEYGKPNNSKLENFILNGTITEDEINQFKTIKDIRLDFVVMTIENENKMMEMLNKKTLLSSQNRMRA